MHKIFCLHIKSSTDHFVRSFCFAVGQCEPYHYIMLLFENVPILDLHIADLSRTLQEHTFEHPDVQAIFPRVPSLSI
jgi:hypothetical protein